MISLRSKLTQAVLGYFMLHEEVEVYVNEMARLLSQDQGNLDRKLKELEKEGLLKSELRGKQRYYSLNASFPLLAEYKKIVLKTVGFEQNLRQLLQGIKGLKHAYLFGPYAQNKMDASSDIDLLVIGNHSSIDLHKRIAEIQKSTKREINVINLTSNDYEKKAKADPFLKSILIKKKIQLL